MEAFDRAYRKAGETSQPQDWMDAALLAQQFRNVAYAVLTDEAPKQEPPASTGWVLVPREPTDAMIQDGGSMLPPTHRLTDCYDYFREAWAAALDARPIPPSALAGEAGTPSSTPHPQSPSLSEVEEAPTGETLETIAQWCEETFGPVTPERVAKRAAEEMDELLAEPTRVKEAADVVIVLSRYPGLWAAVERKMAVNRARKWRLMGDGTGYHVKPEATALATLTASQEQDSEVRS
jgi:hypothetical protein